MLNFEAFVMAFVTIFLAELGDKTQIAVLTLSSKTKSPFSCFLGASIALSLLSFLGAYFGIFLLRFIPKDIMEKLGGIIFIILGFLMIFRGE